jgi:ribosome-interacting GTPase 1
MPTNVSPEYKAAEAEFKVAREPAERLRWLREMLRTIPKHKGTEHLQADIKTRIKQLSEELAGPKKGGARTGPLQAIRPEGAAQVALVGPPNAGKSSLLVRLTGAQTDVGPYPFTTRTPIPGMLPYGGTHFQLVDLPPVSREHMVPWYVNALQPAHAALLVVDLSDPECLDHLPAILEQLDARRVTLEETWPWPIRGEAAGGEEGSAPAGARAAGEDGTGADGAGEDDGEDDDVPDPFRLHLPTILVANKSDLDPDPDEVRILEELLGVGFPAVAVSAETGSGLDAIAPILFRGLGIVRVFTKAPGRPPDTGKPYTVTRGATVLDVARLIHREMADGLKFAKVWGSGQFDGQQVGVDHPVADGDVVELHSG